MTDGRRRGKDAERQVARRLGGKRTLIHGVPAPDVESSWFVAEVKTYQKAPEVPFRELRELRARERVEKLHLFIFKRPGWQDFVVCCLLKEFEEWYGTVVPPGGKGKEEEHDRPG